MKQPARPSPATRRIASFTPGVGAGYTPSLTMATNPPNASAVPTNVTVIAVCSGVSAVSTANITALDVGNITRATGPLTASLTLPSYTSQPGYYLSFIPTFFFDMSYLGNPETGDWAEFTILNASIIVYCYQNGQQVVPPVVPSIEAYDWNVTSQTPFVMQVYQDGTPSLGTISISVGIGGLLVTYPAK